MRSVLVKIPMALLAFAFMCTALSTPSAYSNPPLLDMDNLAKEVHLEYLDEREINDFNSINKYIRLVYIKHSDGHYSYVIFVRSEFEDKILTNDKLNSSLAEKLALLEIKINEGSQQALSFQAVKQDINKLIRSSEQLAEELNFKISKPEHVYGWEGLDRSTYIPVHIESVKTPKEAMSNINQFSNVIIRHILSMESHLLKNMRHITKRQSFV
ncbi:hypothetical protein N9W41_00840, partial [bacterium]|nr:hypothetical protein [bacterium]